EDLEGCGNNIFIDCKTPIYAGYHTILAKKNNNEIGQYLAYLFASRNWRWQVRSLVNGVKVFSITQTILKSVYVILPPIEEQLAIVHYLNIKVGNIEKIIKSIENYISLLQERKQIIINDVVTGKVKVV
ncbi:MAG: restriction endonuclease subunit S, partial [Prevotellaceae bacterium]|nr:restriction endonuclease subunit S [Prevotellaceae bacterium]